MSLLRQSCCKCCDQESCMLHIFLFQEAHLDEMKSVLDFPGGKRNQAKDSPHRLRFIVRVFRGSSCLLRSYEVPDLTPNTREIQTGVKHVACYLHPVPTPVPLALRIQPAHRALNTGICFKLSQVYASSTAGNSLVGLPWCGERGRGVVKMR